jgi:hypothetical protein
MYFVEIFDHDLFRRVVGGGVSLASTRSVAYHDASIVYPAERLEFVQDRSHEPGFLQEARMSNGLRYRIRVGQDELNRLVNLV